MLLQRNRRSGVFFLLLVLIAVAASCTVSRIAPYDAGVTEQARQIASRIDRFYLTMLEIPSDDPEARNYRHFSGDYIDVEVELNDLLLKNRIKPLNRESVRNIEILLETWESYKARHKKDDTLPDADIELNRDFMRDLLIVVIIGEQGKSNIR